MADAEYGGKVAGAIAAAMYYRSLDTDQLAARIGVHVETVRRWLRGQNLPSVDDLSRIAEELDAPGDLFLRPPVTRDRALTMMVAWDALRGQREGEPRL